MMRQRRFLSKTRGQVLVLGALTCLVTAISLMMTISIAWQVRNRIQLQHAADAKSFADAVVTARAFNTFAYTNRAIAGNVVSMTILHALHSEVSVAADLSRGIQLMWIEWAAIEACGTCLFCPIRCLRASLALALGVLIDGTLPYWTGVMGRRLRATEPAFIDAVNSINNSILNLSSLQDTIKGELQVSEWVNMLGMGANMDEVNMINGNSFRMSMITDMVSEMASGDSDSIFENSSARRARDLDDAANASRPQWVRNRLTFSSTVLFLEPLANDLMEDMINVGSWRGGAVAMNVGGSGAYDDFPQRALYIGFLAPQILGLRGSPDSNIRPRDVASYDSWVLGGLLRFMGRTHPVAVPLPTLSVFPLPTLPAVVMSNTRGGEHTGGGASILQRLGIPNNPHSGSHRIDLDDYFDFVSYNSNADGLDNYGQPSAFSSFSVGSLSTRYDSSAPSNYRAPFDLNINANIGGEASIDLRNSSGAKAVSKSLTYYHHPGNWKEPPNFWNPFWRAKLEEYTVGDVLEHAVDFIGF